MITVEKLRAVKKIVSHKDCADGIASVMILKDVLPEAEVIFAHYNSPEQKNLVAEPGMLFCDFSPTRERVKEFVEVGALCLDHHKFARDVVEAFGENGVFADEKTEPGVCGAVLAYRHVWQPVDAARHSGPMTSPDAEEGVVMGQLSALAGVRDTWQKDDPRWTVACHQAEALRFWPLSYLIGKDPLEWAKLIQPIGRVLFEKNLDYAKHLAETAYRFVTKRGTRVVIFSGVSMSSDTAEALGDEADVVVGFSYKCDDGKPGLIYSTRSHTNFDVGAFCVAQGGGGHTKAAGFSHDVKLDENGDPNPFLHFKNILENYEDNLAKERIGAALGDAWATGIAHDEKTRSDGR
jgi:oligoribonuclease NrnB/cAMP/cGMP phosphodiesterase (DHH superfamily)